MPARPAARGLPRPASLPGAGPGQRRGPSVGAPLPAARAAQRTQNDVASAYGRLSALREMDEVSDHLSHMRLHQEHLAALDAHAQQVDSMRALVRTPLAECEEVERKRNARPPPDRK